MQQAKKFSFLPFYFFLLGVLLCGSLVQFGINGFDLAFGVDVSNIREIQAEPDNGATVYLQGKVIDIVPLLDGRVYQLQDSSGTIWVLSEQTILQLQDQVSLQGQVRYQSIPLAGKDFGEVYVEQQKLLERIATP